MFYIKFMLQTAKYVMYLPFFAQNSQNAFMDRIPEDPLEKG